MNITVKACVFIAYLISAFVYLTIILLLHNHFTFMYSCYYFIDVSNALNIFELELYLRCLQLTYFVLSRPK